MRSRLNIAWLLVLVVLAAGCYESPVPIAPPGSVAVDSSLLGRWEQVGPEAGLMPSHLGIEAEDAFLYSVRFCCADAPTLPADTAHLRAFVTLVDDVPFVNVQDASGVEPYFFFRYALTPDSILTLWPVGGCVFDEPLLTSEALEHALRLHLDNERLYLDEPLQFKRLF